MKIAVVGSRGLKVENMGEHLSECDEIISGGATGVDACAAAYAKRNGIKLTEILPQYSRYGKAAPIIRNREIVQKADKILIFWDGRSRGTMSVIELAKKSGKEWKLILCKQSEWK